MIQREWPWQGGGPRRWTTENRARDNRDTLRYPSDVTEEAWRHSEPLIPAAKHGGRKRAVNIRAVLNGLLDVRSTGCPWRSIPQDLAPQSPVFQYCDFWKYDGTRERLPYAL